jgi:hypothetical protein
MRCPFPATPSGVNQGRGAACESPDGAIHPEIPPCGIEGQRPSLPSRRPRRRFVVPISKSPSFRRDPSRATQLRLSLLPASTPTQSGRLRGTSLPNTAGSGTSPRLPAENFHNIG